MSAPHAEDLDLELARTGEASPEVAAHLAACARCQARQRTFAELGGALRRPPLPVPAALEVRLLGMARRSPTRSARRVGLLVGVPAAAAAGLVMALWPRVLPDPAADAPSARHALADIAGDVDGDGVVDILDAMLLARRVQSGAIARSQWDLTGDARVDRADVDAIAMLAVAVGDVR